MTFTRTLRRPAAPASELTADAGLSRRMITLFSVAAGLAVANIYYAQPLLAAIADTFGVGSGTASLIVTLGQLGYTAGLGLIVPLGDSVNRRHLITSLLAITTVALAVSAAAPRFAVLALASGVLAVTAVVGPILVPFAATLAAPEQRGQVTGTVMSGVLFGVLLSRTVGGLLAQLAGWRTVFATAAASTAVLAVTLYRVLPDLPHTPRLRYLSLLASVASLVRQEPTLRLRAAYGFFGFGAFSILWTSVAFLLARTYHFDAAVIGLFGLAGAAGALAARVTGRLTDRGLDGVVTVSMLVAILLGWVLMGWHGGHTLPLLIAGILILDLGVQGNHVTNLAVVYRLHPESRSRLTTAYFVFVFLGGLAGSSASGLAYAHYGWTGVTLAGAGFTVAALVICAATSPISRRLARTAPTPPRQSPNHRQRGTAHRRSGTSSPGSERSITSSTPQASRCCSTAR
jgi:predicted MFS family arabinose efflux permease